jgi:serine-type D-Ala-D-Ala carboxypeptidase/endopeptidase (penicillin-binding protein 4)
VDNGAGLSREASISAQALGQMLQTAWGSAVMSEFMSSLPIAGLDGTLRRSRASANAHLKTGSLRNANALAGYVDGASGQRYALVALINHANAGSARPALDALVDWVAQDDSSRPR